MQINRPLPIISDINAPFFEAAAEGNLLLQRCMDCRKWIYYPRYICPHCFSNELEWAQASGRGRIYSYTLVFRPQHNYFSDKVPIRLIAVELEEGPIVISDLIDMHNAEPEIGETVCAVYEVAAPGIGLVHFERIYNEKE